MSPQVLARRAPKRRTRPEAASQPASVDDKKSAPLDAPLRQLAAAQAVQSLRPSEFKAMQAAIAYLTEHREEGYNSILDAAPAAVAPVLPFLRKHRAFGYRNVIHALQARANGK